MADLSEWRDLMDKKRADLARARASVQLEKRALGENEEKSKVLAEAQEIAQRVAQEVQQDAHRRIAEIVTRCIQTVFPEKYEFKIEFERKRGRTEARLLFTLGGYEVDPVTECGGGLVDVAAFGLRLACLVLARPKLRQLLILDEGFKFVSPHSGLRPRVRHLLETVSREMGVQIVLVSHSRALKTGLVVDLSKKK